MCVEHATNDVRLKKIEKKKNLPSYLSQFVRKVALKLRAFWKIIVINGSDTFFAFPDTYILPLLIVKGSGRCNSMGIAEII